MNVTATGLSFSGDRTRFVQKGLPIASAKNGELLITGQIIHTKNIKPENKIAQKFENSLNSLPVGISRQQALNMLENLQKAYEEFKQTKKY